MTSTSDQRGTYPEGSNCRHEWPSLGPLCPFQAYQAMLAPLLSKCGSCPWNHMIVHRIPPYSSWEVWRDRCQYDWPTSKGCPVGQLRRCESIFRLLRIGANTAETEEEVGCASNKAPIRLDKECQVGGHAHLHRPATQHGCPEVGLEYGMLLFCSEDNIHCCCHCLFKSTPFFLMP